MSTSSARPANLAAHTEQLVPHHDALLVELRGLDEVLSALRASSGDYFEGADLAALEAEITSQLHAIGQLDVWVAEVGAAFLAAESAGCLAPGLSVAADADLDELVTPVSDLPDWSEEVRNFFLGDVGNFWTGGADGFPTGKAASGALRMFRTGVYVHAMRAPGAERTLGVLALNKFPVFNTGYFGKGVAFAAEHAGATGVATWMRTPGATQTFRRLGIAGGVVSTGIDVHNLVQQGHPVDAFEREGAGYVADVARTGFSASSTAFLIAPNPVTGALAIGTGLVWLGAEAWDEWGDDVSSFVDETWDTAWEGGSGLVDDAGDRVTEAWNGTTAVVGDVWDKGHEAADILGGIADSIPTPW